MERIFKKNIIFTLIFILSFGLCAYFIANNNVFADASLSENTLMPNNLCEYYDLQSPTDVYFFGDNVAITQNPDTVVLFYNGEYKTKIKINGTTSLSQIKQLNDEYLLVLGFNVIYKISLLDFSVSNLLDDDNNPITCTHYDIKGSRLVAVSGRDGSAKIYNINKNSIKLQSNVINGINGDKPIAINGDNLIFIKSTDDKVYSCSLVTPTSESKLLLNVNPDTLIVNENHLFYSVSNSIYKVNKEDFNNEVDITPTLLTIENKYANSDKYDLGNIETLSNISFRKDNIVVTDLASNTIEEFLVEGNKISFTGFAIAHNKTAYNRVNSPIDVQRVGETIALLDELRVMLIKPGFDDAYSINRFENLFIEENVSHFALGLKGILYKNQDGVFFYDLNERDVNKKITPISTTGVIKDIIYKFGNYYLVSNENLDSNVYTINEETLELSSDIYLNQLFNLIDVDVFNNIYLSDSNYIYKNGSKVTTLNGASKIQSDFIGNVYKITNGKVYKLVDKSWEAVDGLNSNISSFSLSYDKKEVYYVLKNKDFVISTTNADNIAINSTLLPSDFILTGSSANINSLTTSKIVDEPNVFSVSFDNDNFVFNKLTEKDAEYVFICDIKHSNKVIYKCLSGINGLVLCQADNIVCETPTFEYYNDVMFITTSVHAYYYPLMTLDGIHYLDSNNGSLLLEKYKAINVVKKCVVSDREFYLIEIDKANNIYGYVPSAFTVKTLSKNAPLINYSIETVKKTSVYSDEALTNEIKILEDGTSIYILEKKDNKYLALFDDGENLVPCYVLASAIKNTPNIAIRNLLIILAVIACVSTTSTYFLLRKRKE